MEDQIALLRQAKKECEDLLDGLWQLGIYVSKDQQDSSLDLVQRLRSVVDADPDRFDEVAHHWRGDGKVGLVSTEDPICPGGDVRIQAPNYHTLARVFTFRVLILFETYYRDFGWPAVRREMMTTSLPGQTLYDLLTCEYYAAVRSVQKATGPIHLTTTARSGRESKIEWLAKAMLLVNKHPDWTDAKIAAEVGKDPSTLSRSPEYQQAAAMARGSKDDRPKGHRVLDPDTGLGGVEAFSEDSVRDD
jgi:hypothetical protein